MFDYTWYQNLNQPLFTPPTWIFTPVWTCIYIIIFVSLIFYAKNYKNNNKSLGYIIFTSQMLINLSWTPVFFGLKNIGLALALIIILDILVLYNIIEFNKNSKAASILLIPYLIWILFATYLNLGYFILN